MIIQATPYGTKKEEPFAFTYSGDFTDSRVDGIGDVTLNTSGQLVTTGKTVKVTVYILGAGGGGAQRYPSLAAARRVAGGGSGGVQTQVVTLAPGTYEIVIGVGGKGAYAGATTGTQTGTAGGDTSAFGFVSTGGTGGKISGSTGTATSIPGAGGSPDGNAGSGGTGGAPNGGKGDGGSAAANNGGNGLVRITFS